MREEFRRVLPLVVLELPSLTGGEDGHDTGPVVRTEIVRAVDEGEGEGVGADGGEVALEAHHVDAGVGGVGAGVGSVGEEGFDVGHTQ